MSLTQRLGRIEKHVSGLTATASRRGKVIILRNLCHAPDATLIGYRDGSGNLLPLDRSQWPHVPEGKKLVIHQVWSDDEDSDLPNLNTDPIQGETYGTLTANQTTREDRDGHDGE